MRHRDDQIGLCGIICGTSWRKFIDESNGKFATEKSQAEPTYGFF